MSLPKPHQWLPMGGGFLIPTITILTCAPFSSPMLDKFADRAFLASRLWDARGIYFNGGGAATGETFLPEAEGRDRNELRRRGSLQTRR